MNDIDIPLFTGGPVSTEEFCAAQAEAIRLLVKRTAADILDIGRRLLAVRGHLPHGKWLPWLDREFGWSEATAKRFIQVAETFGDKSLIMSDLQIDAGALYCLAAPFVPENIRDEALELARSGEHITKAKAEEMVADAKLEAAAAKENEFREAFAKAEKLEAGRIKNAVAEATKRLRDDKKALAAELAEIRKPDLNNILRGLRRILGRKDLTADQYRWLAQILGQTIAVGHKTYQPISKEEIAANEERLRIASAVTVAFETLSGAPPARALKDAVWPVQRKQHMRVLPQIIEWLTEYRDALAEGE